jgi:hypothetical protein
MFDVLTPRNLFRTALDVGMMSARALESAAGESRDRARWAELRNRLHAYKLFQYADYTLGGTELPGLDLAIIIGRTSPLDPADRVWTAEGAGYRWAEANAGAGREPLLAPVSVPEWTQIPLHAGTGLSIATHTLSSTEATERPQRTAEVLVERSARSAVSGFERVAFESVGLVLRNLYPHLLPDISSVVAAGGKVLQACLWHGIGRGTYFAPSNWGPAQSSIRNALAGIEAQTRDASSRSNATAGLIWALNLVNLRTPEVLAAAVAAVGRQCDAEAFANGIMSSLVVWQHAAPGDSAVTRLIEYEPDEPVRRLWDSLVRRPAELAVRAFPDLVHRRRLADVFYCEAA